MLGKQYSEVMLALLVSQVCATDAESHFASDPAAPVSCEVPPSIVLNSLASSA
jgi:hypothetical protein